MFGLFQAVHVIHVFNIRIPYNIL